MSGDTPRLRPTTGRRISAWAAISVLIVAAGAFAKGDWFAAESASHPSNPGPVQEVLAAAPANPRPAPPAPTPAPKPAPTSAPTPDPTAEPLRPHRHRLHISHHRHHLPNHITTCRDR